MFDPEDLPRVFSNGFDACEVAAQGNSTVLKCTSTLNAEQRHYLHDRQLAICASHLCAVRAEPASGAHNVLTCSGAVRRVSSADPAVEGGVERSGSYFNPLAPSRVDFAQLRASSSPFWFSAARDHFYLSDVRTVFYENLASVSCTDAGATCVVVTDGTELCFGNVGAGAGAVVPDASAFALGFVVVHLLGVFIFTAVHPVLGADLTDSLGASVTVYAVPAAAACMLATGSSMMGPEPWLLGAALAYCGVIVVVSSVRAAAATLFQTRQ